ncbi:glycosyltransferase family 2 protein [Autumnicola psychrophila]|uniref:Glycosyltransferase family 2 protein n=1 Tax=Autumnicola psychrophila TaxID=3075592 RepID=A0ABU3DS93_9FLAO|nr:glycosyltransferase family 2 protein [Zunongwangia sp. F225]MDT0686582.1 glycosyltransferase family 2 protein [Zunongwangia sp. F225]
MPHISIVSPVYRAERTIPVLIERIEKSVQKITNDYEIILVEDGGPDDSWKVIQEYAEKNDKIIGIELSRNFGQHYAITAGLDYAKGDWVVVMDCDLQDQPEEILKLYNKAQEGFDVVLARRFERKDHFFKRFFSKVFYRSLGYLTGSEQDESVANFGIYHRKVVDAVCSMRESIRYFPTMVKWVGFRTTKVNVDHDNRLEGESSYNFKRLINLAMDIILAFSDKPIRLLIKFGLIISVLSVIVAFIYLVKWLTGGVVVLGYTSLIVSVWLLSGVIISTLGIIGLYVGKTFEGVKQRPIYIVKKKIN